MFNKNMRRFGVAHEFKTLFRSDFDLLLFFNMYNSKQFLAPGGLNAECVQVSVMLTWGLDLGSWI